MSGTDGDQVLANTVTDITTVPSDVQKQLGDYWKQFGPNAGTIIATVGWDDGGTTWDDGATVWLS
jgi:hypothetical protein